jgi:hypothetical protein
MINVKRPVLFGCRVAALENCFPIIPGKAHNEMLPVEATDEATATASAAARRWCGEPGRCLISGIGARAEVVAAMPPTRAYAVAAVSGELGATVVIKHENHTDQRLQNTRRLVYVDRLKRERLR